MPKKMDAGAYLGSDVKGYPFSDKVPGDFRSPIAYDSYNANSEVIMQDGDVPVILTPYGAAARKLVQYLKAEKGQKILELGPKTGISTLELFSQHPDVCVVSVENTESMLSTALYKFHQWDGKELLEQAGDDPALLEYWKNFRKDSEGYKDQVEFILGDFQDIDSIEPESIDSVIANQFMHWTDLSKSFGQLNTFLKAGGEVIWNSASHFYNDEKFPSDKYGFRYNGIMKYILDEVGKHFEVNKDYLSLSQPQHDIESIKAITSKQGLETEQIATSLFPVDMQVFIQNHVPVFVKELMISEADVDEVIRESIAKAVATPGALRDIEHKNEIAPVFRSRKI
ncbi:MAG: methyltransferase domain-containing protein [Nanohaloarchaea archaeon]|nr:methyltransferase domain-containing protein [Candidatus Nanohaloarchaea archaeon]